MSEAVEVIKEDLSKVKDNLVKDSKSGNTPARDLNNYNDVMDVGADGEVGGVNGLAFAKGGKIEN